MARSSLLVLPTLTVGDAQTDVDPAHNAMPPTWGTCVPATGNQYDGTCSSATQVIPLTAWVLPWSGTGAAKHAVDIVVDNIKFRTP